MTVLGGCDIRHLGFCLHPLPGDFAMHRTWRDTYPYFKPLQSNPQVVLTIDNNTFPYKVLQIRGTAQVETVEGVVPEYAIAADRYFGAEQGKGWVKPIRGMFPQMARIAIQPEWVGILDFEQRFPSVIEAAMSNQ